MSSGAQTGDVNDLLEEETEEEKQFHLANQQSALLTGGVAIGIVHSATTDTLDSVYLDPPALDQEMNLSGEVDLGEQRNIKEIGGNINATSENEANKVKNDDVFDITKEKERENVATDMVSFSFEGHNDTNIAAGTTQDSQPSLSKYFGAASDTKDPFSENFFDAIPEGEVLQEDIVNNFNIQSENLDTENAIDTMLELTLDDSKDILSEIDNMKDPAENSNNNHQSNDKSTVESVDFDLEFDATEKVETPVAIEEKDNFESFTADLADTETLDALGMSPAAPSFMTDRNIHDYFRQSSQSDSVPSLNLTRQVSVASAKSASSQDPGSIPSVSPRETIEQKTNNLDMSESAVMTTQDALSQSQATHSVEMRKRMESAEATPTHQPMFPPSTTLSPVDSPVHQQAARQSSGTSVEEHRVSTSSIPTSPEHRLSAFQNFTDSGVGDDPFAASLQMSDSDRQHDAWIPSEATKNILIAMATHPVGTYMPNTEMLCSPTLVITEPQGDPVRDLVYRYMGEQEALKRQVLNSDKVSKDFEGLQKLMASGCYRSAIDMCGRLLTEAGQAEKGEEPTVHTPDTLKLWHCRLSLMTKLRMYSVVESEFVAFLNLDSPDIYYEFYPQLYPGKRGSMVSFGMRLMHAELPHHLGRSQETLDRLYYMLAITQKIMKNLQNGLCEDGNAITISAESKQASMELWQEREKQVLYCIGNTLVSLRDYDAALTVYEILLEKDSTHKTGLLSGIGRIHLQIGNLQKAMEYFQEVRTAADPNDETAITTFMLNRGFESMCQNNFSEAYQHFKLAVEADPTNTSAVNNMSVCCLYLGKLKEALKSLEALVHSSPDKNLHEGILFNLCTLYELESSRALHKKQALLDLVSKHKGDGFPVVCLKMA